MFTKHIMKPILENNFNCLRKNCDYDRFLLPLFILYLPFAGFFVDWIVVATVVHRCQLKYIYLCIGWYYFAIFFFPDMIFHYSFSCAILQFMYMHSFTTDLSVDLATSAKVHTCNMNLNRLWIADGYLVF